jgi:hypothetical protein
MGRGFRFPISSAPSPPFWLFPSAALGTCPWRAPLRPCARAPRRPGPSLLISGDGTSSVIWSVATGVADHVGGTALAFWGLGLGALLNPLKLVLNLFLKLQKHSFYLRDLIL